ncbi:hypothetical protein K488DRAFT_84192 [Vararia minispora EC-137]|uniref:Uncharacterized protein n=1 Tax=Vararia minispora EC-137 TaxID=1314806 RepID=A0ACB8QRC1_9AGAM|nr:hypothetical protein K488DRAFT_84192 [Vararia minispora EC-137]
MVFVIKKPDLVRLSDATLGAFARVPPSETLDHLLRYLSTWSGSDKLFMVIQYGAKVLVPILQFKARLQHRAGMRGKPTSDVAASLKKFASLVSDARALWGMWGILPIVQWLISLERSPPPTRRLLTIERTQGWAMLAFYPLDHLYYLITHDLMSPTLSLPFANSISKRPPGIQQLRLDSAKISRWSTRFWAVYVILQLIHLREDRALLLRRQKALKKARGLEHANMKKQWEGWYNELAVNLAYFPLTIHWSLDKGLFKNNIWVDLLGLAAALASFRGGWKATALPASSSLPLEPVEEIAGIASSEKPEEVQDSYSA